MREWHILNLGAGVQSTTLYLMACEGELSIDRAVFADTGEEPSAVYDHLAWLQSLDGPEIATVSAGKLGDDLKQGNNSTGQRFAAVPFFTAERRGKPDGITRRQCTREYKIEPVDRYVRRELLGLEPRKHVPKDVLITQYFGFSVDEAGRAARVRGRFDKVRHATVRFPLIEDLMSRGDCLRYLDGRVPHQTPRSACCFCPYRSNAEWRNLRDTDPEGWERAVEIDRAIREPGAVVNRNLNQQLYAHRSCVPLAEANLHDDQGHLFDLDCEGGCGL